ncbi:hypothetical protein [Actinokineospora xionganensis]|uniref:Uncharacterized protein n=1 Tax=Actinokineospora xionganensis TaxID=2684470 RepID=A0ABR7LF39_9PSEU|nr:hypothetical protein [Actinokineospora xionganensis]MBC6451284.1 hypothetical protein [Actinokineospora xionganensis]
MLPPSELAKYFQTAGATGIDAAFVMSRLLWRLGIGELANLEGEGWALLGQGNHVLWSERRGVHEARRWSLKRKFGSR